MDSSKIEFLGSRIVTFANKVLLTHNILTNS